MVPRQYVSYNWSTTSATTCDFYVDWYDQGTGTTSTTTWTTTANDWYDTSTSTGQLSYDTSNTWLLSSNDALYVDNQYSVREETEEEKEARLELERKRLRAQAKALRLFRSIVGRDAYRNYRRRKYHEVVGDSGIRYRLRAGAMIDVMEGPFGDTVAYRLCIHHPLGSVPKMDTLIHQMLLITCGDAGEKELKAVANEYKVA